MTNHVLDSGAHVSMSMHFCARLSQFQPVYLEEPEWVVVMFQWCVSHLSTLERTALFQTTRQSTLGTSLIMNFNRVHYLSLRWLGFVMYPGRELLRVKTNGNVPVYGRIHVIYAPYTIAFVRITWLSITDRISSCRIRRSTTSHAHRLRSR